jgi:hypothetical protein
MCRTKNLNLEVFSLKCEAQRRERYIRDLESKLCERIDDINRADWELRQPDAGSGRNFALFRFQLDTLTILYIYNLGFF